jgi:hypothetical protein
MREICRLLLTTAAAVIVCLSSSQVMAQTNQGGRQRQRPGNFDPAQFQQRMMERYRERLELTDDTEWKAVQPLIQKVLDERTALGTGRGAFGTGARPGADRNTADQGQRRPVRGNPAAEELEKALDAKAEGAEMKAALARYVDYRKAKQADLEKARNALRAVLTPRQEAIATLLSLL